MKKAEIEIGGHYVAKVSGRLTVIKTDRTFRSGSSGRIHFQCTNLRSGRQVHMTAAKMRRVATESEVERFSK
jgi:hypothetical protein